MDVQTLSDQERTVTQLRSQENLVRQERERIRWRAAEWERRAFAAAAGPRAILAHSVLRPFGSLMFRMGEPSRHFHRFTALTTSAIGKTVSDTLKIGETYRRLIDPIPAIKSVLEPFTVAPAFDAMRYVRPLVEFERQFNVLRDQSFSRFSDLRSKASDTIVELSRVVKLATTVTESTGVPLPESYADFSLSDVVDFVGEAVESSGEPDWLEVTAFLQRMEMRLCVVDLKLSTPTFRDNVTFWIAVVSFLIGVLSLCLQFSQNPSLSYEKQPVGLQSPTPTPPTPDDRDRYTGPCP